jgi:hypothetical protein
MQADNHAFILAKELQRVDVKGLSIINHQRHIPPLDRENRMPFRQELLDVTTGTNLGLMTAFDLYRLAVNVRRLNWSGANVAIITNQPLLEKDRRHAAFVPRYGVHAECGMGQDCSRSVMWESALATSNARELNTTSRRIQYSVPRLTNIANDLARKRPKA